MMREKALQSDLDDFVKVVREALAKRLEFQSLKLIDIGMVHASHFLATPGVDWYALIGWCSNPLTCELKQFNQKIGGSIGHTEPEDVGPLVMNISDSLVKEFFGANS